MRLLRGQRQTALNALADGIVHAAWPGGEIQDVALMGTQHRRAAELRAEHLQRCADRLLVMRRGRINGVFDGAATNQEELLNAAILSNPGKGANP